MVHSLLQFHMGLNIRHSNLSAYVVSLSNAILADEHAGTIMRCVVTFGRDCGAHAQGRAAVIITISYLYTSQFIATN